MRRPTVAANFAAAAGCAFDFDFDYFAAPPTARSAR
jgi:hypothetical protein